MPLRELCDPNAVVWQVWDVRPAWITAERLAGRWPGESRLSVEPALADGWLAFASAAGERRRVVPIPEGWIRWTTSACAASSCARGPSPRGPAASSSKAE
jgi:hypothetical protein